jgi:hypothetical protein
MAKGGMNKVIFEAGAPKKTRQGRSSRTLLSATSRNGRKKRYRGQGRWFNWILQSQSLLQRVMVGHFFVLIVHKSTTLNGLCF